MWSKGINTLIVLSLLILGSCKDSEPVCVTDTAQGTWYRSDDTRYTLTLDGWYLVWEIPNQGKYEHLTKKECDRSIIARDTFYFNLQNDTLYMERVGVTSIENTKWIKL